MNPQIADKYFETRRPPQKCSPKGATDLPPSAPSAPRFTTVAIPDLRNQDFASLSEMAIAVDAEPVTAAGQSDRNKAGGPEDFPIADSQAEVRAAIGGTISKHENFSGRECQTAEPVLTSTVDRSLRSDAHGEGIQAWLSQIEPQQPQIEAIVDSVMANYPAGGSAIVLFAATENNRHLDAVIAATAVAAQVRTGKKVLLIDSDFDQGGLTYAMECVGQPGLADLMDDPADSQRCLADSVDKAAFDFLPLGRVMLDTSNRMQNMLGPALAQLGQRFGHIFVNVGDAHGPAASTWSRYANGSYLLVSVKNSNQAIAKSAVTHLNSCGARLLGCIASDAEI